MVCNGAVSGIGMQGGQRLHVIVIVIVVFSIPFLLDQEVILLRHSLLMDQVPVFLPMEPRLALYGRPL